MSPLAQPINPAARIDAVVQLADRWTISCDLAARLHLVAQLLPFGITIISGHRTPREQAELERQGRPTAPAQLSTHLSCPATGADIRFQVEATIQRKRQFGAAAHAAGLRWGGGSAIGADGIPSDWNHVDLGPRLS